MAINLASLAERIEYRVGHHGEAAEYFEDDSGHPHRLRLGRGGLIVANQARPMPGIGPSIDAKYEADLAFIEHLITESRYREKLAEGSGAFVLRVIMDDGEGIWEGRFVPVQQMSRGVEERVTAFFLPNSRIMSVPDLAEAHGLIESYDEAHIQRTAGLASLAIEALNK